MLNETHRETLFAPLAALWRTHFQRELDPNNLTASAADVSDTNIAQAVIVGWQWLYECLQTLPQADIDSFMARWAAASRTNLEDADALAQNQAWLVLADVLMGQRLNAYARAELARIQGLRLGHHVIWMKNSADSLRGVGISFILGEAPAVTFIEIAEGDFAAALAARYVMSLTHSLAPQFTDPASLIQRVSVLMKGTAKAARAGVAAVTIQKRDESLIYTGAGWKGALHYVLQTGTSRPLASNAAVLGVTSAASQRTIAFGRGDFIVLFTGGDVDMVHAVLTSQRGGAPQQITTNLAALTGFTALMM